MKLLLSRRSQLTLGIALVALAAGGCAQSNHTTGRPIADDSVAKLVNGKTTIDDVISMFGAPQSQSAMGNEVLYTYSYAQTKDSMLLLPYFANNKGATTSDELTLTFDKETGILRSHGLQRGIKTES